MNTIKPIWIIATVAVMLSVGLAYVGASHLKNSPSGPAATAAAATSPAADPGPNAPIPVVHPELLANGAPAPAGTAAAPNVTTIPSGTRIDVRLNEPVSSRRSAGSPFSATVSDAVVVDGMTVIPKGAQATGVVVTAKSSGRLKGRAHVTLMLTGVETGGQSYDLDTRTHSAASKGHKKRNWLSIGGTSGTGALIGGLAGGPVGMAIGAGAGAGAGTAFAAATGKKNVVLPAETRVSFALKDPVEIARN